MTAPYMSGTKKDKEPDEKKKDKQNKMSGTRKDEEPDN
jgi:hypothetical protein